MERQGSKYIQPWVENRVVDRIQVLVAVDQLEQARAIAAKPVPQDVVDEVKKMMESADEYLPPVCPKCGAADPILEATEPTNEWLCEACGAEWSDPVEEGGDRAENRG